MANLSTRRQSCPKCLHRLGSVLGDEGSQIVANPSHVSLTESSILPQVAVTTIVSEATERLDRSRLHSCLLRDDGQGAYPRKGCSTICSARRQKAKHADAAHSAAAIFAPKRQRAGGSAKKGPPRGEDTRLGKVYQHWRRLQEETGGPSTERFPLTGFRTSGLPKPTFLVDGSRSPIARPCTGFRIVVPYPRSAE
jgi:hypothetical protein